LFYRFLLDHLNFDQLILEFPDENENPAWVHVSYRNHKTNRQQVLIAIKENGKTKYIPYV
jgi:hypothetical protein